MKKNVEILYATESAQTCTNHQMAGGNNSSQIYVWRILEKRNAPSLSHFVQH